MFNSCRSFLIGWWMDTLGSSSGTTWKDCGCVEADWWIAMVVLCFYRLNYVLIGWVLHILHCASVSCQSPIQNRKLESSSPPMQLYLFITRESPESGWISATGWWFGTFSIFQHIGNSHPNWLSYVSEGSTTKQQISTTMCFLLPSAALKGTSKLWTTLLFDLLGLYAALKKLLSWCCPAAAPRLMMNPWKGWTGWCTMVYRELNVWHEIRGILIVERNKKAVRLESTCNHVYVCVCVVMLDFELESSQRPSKNGSNLGPKSMVESWIFTYP